MKIKAGPGFSLKDNKTRLAINDAIYTEAIHTNTGCYGFKEPICHADFYPNGL